MKRKVIFTILFLLLFSNKTYCGVEEKINESMIKYSNEFNIDICLVYAIYKNEGNIKDPTLTSKTNNDGSFDIGIMQVNSNNTDVMKKCGVTDLTDIDSNIKCAVYIMYVNKITLENKGITPTIFNHAMMYNMPKNFYSYYYNDGTVTESNPTVIYAYNVFQDYCYYEEYFKEMNNDKIGEEKEETTNSLLFTTR